jgi:receptor protein-tyrosine kinase
MSSFAENVPRRFVDDPYLVLKSYPESPLAERYRRLRLRIEQETPSDPVRSQVTVITSAIPGEGKTTTATNLALAYAEDTTRRTLLIGADLRRPSMSRYITPLPTLGLSHVLAGEASLDDALIEMSDSSLWVLPAGPPDNGSIDLLRQRALGHVMAELRLRFQRIVIDAPPTVPFTDAAVLASHADGALLVVRAGFSTPALIRRARESLSGLKVLGVVLNDVVFTFVDRYYYGYDDIEPGGRSYAQKREQYAGVNVS